MSSVAEQRLGALVDGRPAASYDELRFVETISALRAARPRAPQAVRERVCVSAVGASARRSFGVSWRRAALIAAPACLAIALGGAVLAGALSSGSRGVPSTVHGQARGGTYTPFSGGAVPGANKGQGNAFDSASRAVQAAPQALSRQVVVGARASLPPSSTRLQAYDAYLRLRVRGTGRLSSATKRAMAVARSLGGYVAAVDLDTAKQGDASLRLRVPIGRVQAAIARLSGLGTILAQSFSVTDLQRQADQQLDTIARTKGRIGRLQLLLRDPSLSPERRASLELALSRAEQALKSIMGQHTATVRRSRLATISVGLTTRNAVVPVRHSGPGRIGRALDDAGSVLGHELAWALYLLIVAAPLVLLAALVVAATRFVRRRSDRLVLERI
jgi:Domain of unknown function (DUF4349)